MVDFDRLPIPILLLTFVMIFSLSIVVVIYGIPVASRLIAILWRKLPETLQQKLSSILAGLLVGFALVAVLWNLVTFVHNPGEYFSNIGEILRHAMDCGSPGCF